MGGGLNNLKMVYPTPHPGFKNAPCLISAAIFLSNPLLGIDGAGLEGRLIEEPMFLALACSGRGLVSVRGLLEQVTSDSAYSHLHSGNSNPIHPCRSQW